ncbi:MAG TPA: hypothetical protein VFN94_02340 [Nitrospiria bacterium]|nr:hypothetical protein [Nitrospiria bacterium]
MMRATACGVAAALAVMVAGGSAAWAAKDIKVVVPNTIVNGMGDYAFQGADAAVKTWVKGTHLEGSPEAAIQVNNLKRLEAAYGKFQGYHIVQVHELTPLSEIVYLAIHYERGPVFGRFLAYRIKDG